jgi:3-hydroxyethyl bacteriochlorophyllide a dehydrogenase
LTLANWLGRGGVVDATAIVFDEPGALALRRLALVPPSAADVVVDVEWTGISTGTERLLWTGRMPVFPGMGYPLVPGYETVGRVRQAGAESGVRAGDRVFVPGSHSFTDARNLFGGAARTVVARGARVIPIGDALEADAVLLSLAATAYHALVTRDAVGAPVDPRAAAVPPTLPDLIVGHGALGRLLARLVIALGGAAPTVWEIAPARRTGAAGYRVCTPEADERRDYACICDASGDGSLLDALIARLRPGGELVLAGFYHEPLSFRFPPAFMRGLRLRIAAEFAPAEMLAVRDLVVAGTLSLDGLITDRADAADAATAYPTAFEEPSCVKMVLDWRRSA